MEISRRCWKPIQILFDTLECDGVKFPIMLETNSDSL